MEYLSTALLFHLASSIDVLPNIEYLGLGYDIIKGDVLTASDSGQRIPVLNLTYNENQTIENGQYEFLIPDNIIVIPYDFCVLRMGTSNVFSINDYADYLFLNAVQMSNTLRNIFDNTAYSANSQFQKINASFSKSDKWEFTMSSCPAYYIEMKSYRGSYEVNVNDEFNKDVEDLPLTIDPTKLSDPYYQLIDKYGTSFPYQMSLGVEYLRDFQFTQASWNKMINDDYDIMNVAMWDYEKAIGCDIGSGTPYQEVKEFRSLASSSDFITFGSKQPNCTDYTAWQEIAMAKPFPYQYWFAAISELFTEDTMPNQNASELATKQQNMETALNGYCGLVKGCASY